MAIERRAQYSLHGRDFAPINVGKVAPPPSHIPATICASVALQHEGMDDAGAYADSLEFTRRFADKPAYAGALRMAAETGKAHYVNRFTPDPREKSEWFLFAEPFKRDSCCAIAHPEGRLEAVVQGYCHAVAMTQPMEKEA